MIVDWTSDAAANKLDELVGLKPAVPHVVPLAGDDFQFHRATKFTVSLSQQCRIDINRHDGVLIAMNVENRYLGFGK